MLITVMLTMLMLAYGATIYLKKIVSFWQMVDFSMSSFADMQQDTCILNFDGFHNFLTHSNAASLSTHLKSLLRRELAKPKHSPLQYLQQSSTHAQKSCLRQQDVNIPRDGLMTREWPQSRVWGWNCTRGEPWWLARTGTLDHSSLL